MWNCLLDLLFPQLSLEDRRLLRSSPLVLEQAELKRRGLTFLDRVVAASSYGECPVLRKAICAFKYRRVRSLAEDLGQLLLEGSLRLKSASPVLCPVPLHWVRRFHRGFNQAALLADVVGQGRGWEVRPLLRRIRSTGSQVGRSRKERLAAMRGVFRSAVHGGGIPLHVVLVDDLFTTGATLNACAKVLRSAGAEHVEGITIAYGSDMRYLK